MHVYCDLFDVLEIAERNKNFAAEAPTLLLSRQVAYMKSPTYFVYACLVQYIYLMHVLDSIAMLKPLSPLS